MKYTRLLWMITVLAGVQVHEVQCTDNMSASKTHALPRKRAQQNNQKYLKILLSTLVGAVLLDMLYTYYSRPCLSPAASDDEPEFADQNIEREEEVKDTKGLEHQQGAKYDDYGKALLRETPLPEVIISIIQEYLGGPCKEYQDAKDVKIRHVNLGMRDNRPLLLFQKENHGIISIVDPQEYGQLCPVACSPEFEPSFSRNGKLVCAYDTVFHAYDTQTGKKVQSYREDKNILTSLFGGRSDVCMAFAYNDALVVTHAYQNTTVWNTQTGKRLRTIKSSLPPFTINDHETKLLIMRQPNILQRDTRDLTVVDLKTYAPKTITIPCKSWKSWKAVLTPAGDQVIASTRNEDTYTIFDVVTGLCLKTFRKTVNTVGVPLKVLCNAQNNRLIMHESMGTWHALTLYNSAEQKIISIPDPNRLFDIAQSVQLDRQKELCLVGGVRYPYQIIALKDGKVVHKSERKNSSSTQNIRSLVLGDDKPGEDVSFDERIKQVSAHWGPGDKTIITTDWTGVSRYDAKTHELIRKVSAPGYKMLSHCRQWMLLRNSAENKTTVWYVPQMV